MSTMSAMDWLCCARSSLGFLRRLTLLLASPPALVLGSLLDLRRLWKCCWLSIEHTLHCSSRIPLALPGRHAGDILRCLRLTLWHHARGLARVTLESFLCRLDLYICCLDNQVPFQILVHIIVHPLFEWTDPETRRCTYQSCIYWLRQILLLPQHLSNGLIEGEDSLHPTGRIE